MIKPALLDAIYIYTVGAYSHHDWPADIYLHLDYNFQYTEEVGTIKAALQMQR